MKNLIAHIIYRLGGNYSPDSMFDNTKTIKIKRWLKWNRKLLIKTMAGGNLSLNHSLPARCSV